MRDESVDVERSVGVDWFEFDGRHETDVTPASCPTRRASKVTEKMKLNKLITLSFQKGVHAHCS